MDKYPDPPPPYPFDDLRTEPVVGDHNVPLVYIRPKRECWFVLFKYFIAVKSYITMMGCIMLAVVIVYTSLRFAFGFSIIFLFLVFLAAIPGVIAYYLWKVPIQGSLSESYTRLTIHAIVVFLVLISSRSSNYAYIINERMGNTKLQASHSEYLDGHRFNHTAVVGGSNYSYVLLPGSFPIYMLSMASEALELMAAMCMVLKLHREKVLSSQGLHTVNPV